MRAYLEANQHRSKSQALSVPDARVGVGEGDSVGDILCLFPSEVRRGVFLKSPCCTGSERCYS